MGQTVLSGSPSPCEYALTCDTACEIGWTPETCLDPIQVKHRQKADKPDHVGSAKKRVESLKGKSTKKQPKEIPLANLKGLTPPERLKAIKKWNEEHE